MRVDGVYNAPVTVRNPTQEAILLIKQLQAIKKAREAEHPTNGRLIDIYA